MHVYYMYIYIHVYVCWHGRRDRRVRMKNKHLDSVQLWNFTEHSHPSQRKCLGMFFFQSEKQALQHWFSQELVQKPVSILFLEIVSMLLLFHPAWWAHETCGCRASLEESLRWDVAAALFMALWHSFQIGRAVHRATIDLSSPCCCAGNSGKRVKDVGMIPK